jgi:hypothetical protein
MMGRESTAPAVGAPAAAVPAAERFLRRFRASWARAEMVRGAVLAMCAWLALSALLVAADLLWPLPVGARLLLRTLPFVVAAALLAVRGWRVVRGPSSRRLALRAEEELPQLEQYLTTALDAPAGGAGVSAAFRARAEERLRLLEPAARVPYRVRRTVAAAAGAALALLLVAGLGGPAQVWERWLRPSDVAAADSFGAREARGDLPPELRGAVRLEGLRWRVVPPSYTGLPETEYGDVATLRALPGSRIELRAASPPPGVRAAPQVVGGPSLTPAVAGAGWSAGWTLSAGNRGVVIELLGGDDVLARRVVPIVPLEDRPPEVRLHAPAGDMVVASATGTVRLRATARDDFGVDRFHLTWIHTSGSGESFTFREGEWQWQAATTAAGAVSGDYVLDLAATGMQPGDVLHVRAAARDGNHVTGPGEGVSNTRVIRVARAGQEAEITTLIGFPLEGESDPVLSQRMIILMTEQLRDRRARLTRPALLHGSTEIALEQLRLRSRVGEEVFVRLSAEEEGPSPPAGFRLRELPGQVAQAEAAGAHAGHDHAPARRTPPPGMTEAERMAELLAAASRATGTSSPDEGAHFHDQSPIMSMNPTKLAAFNAMWAAERELRQGELDAALVHEYRALDLMQQLREADRVFVRGRQRVAPIDVGATRGTGRLRDAAPAARSAAPPAPGLRDVVAEVDATLEGLRSRSAREASVELAGLALRLLNEPGSDPAAAALVAEAAVAADAGDLHRASALVLRARSALVPTAAAGTAPPLQGATTPAAAAYFERLRRGGS